MPSFMQKLPHFLSLPFFSLSIHQSFHSSSRQVFSLTRLSTRASVCLLSISSNSSIPPIHQTVLWCCVEANGSWWLQSVRHHHINCHFIRFNSFCIFNKNPLGSLSDSWSAVCTT